MKLFTGILEHTCYKVWFHEAVQLDKIQLLLFEDWIYSLEWKKSHSFPSFNSSRKVNPSWSVPRTLLTTYMCTPRNMEENVSYLSYSHVLIITNSCIDIEALKRSLDKNQLQNLWGSLQSEDASFLHQNWGFPGGSDGQESSCNAGDQGLVPKSGRSPGEGNGYPLQYSCLESSKDRGAWWATVHEVAKSWLTLFLKINKDFQNSDSRHQIKCKALLRVGTYEFE